MADKARQKTDKRLSEMEREIGRIYKNDPALKNIQKEYLDYMNMVDKETKEAYLAYKKSDNLQSKQELKKAYMEQLKALTSSSKKYQSIIHKLAKTLSEVNQKAVEYVNSNMDAVYADNYNQAIIECEKVGIKIKHENKTRKK